MAVSVYAMYSVITCVCITVQIFIRCTWNLLYNYRSIASLPSLTTQSIYYPFQFISGSVFSLQNLRRFKCLAGKWNFQISLMQVFCNGILSRACVSIPRFATMYAGFDRGMQANQDSKAWEIRRHGEERDRNDVFSHAVTWALRHEDKICEHNDGRRTNGHRH